MTTKNSTVLVKIRDEVYDLDESVKHAALGDLIELDKLSRKHLGQSSSAKTINLAIGRIDKIQRDHRSRMREWHQQPEAQAFLDDLKAYLEDDTRGEDTMPEAPEGHPGPPQFDMLDEPSILIAFVSIVWLAKRKSNEPISFEEACRTSFSDITFIVDDGEDDEPDDEDAEPEEQGPKAPAGEPASRTSATPETS